jgi:DNA (cytosine-5)-methyltransferase 1
MRLSAVDLFCGAGGVSLGLEGAGFKVLLANDLDAAAARTYRRNFPETSFFEGDVHKLSNRRIAELTGLKPGELDLLMGGPPCQGFSIIGARNLEDPRNDLFRPFLRIARFLKPKCVVLENVPGLLTLDGGRALRAIVDGLREAGYAATFAELLAAQYGTPQMRWRLVIVGFRESRKLAAGMGFPEPTHGRRGIGELIPNCTIAREDLRGFLTTKDAIADLPPVSAGEMASAYTQEPRLAYHRRCRARSNGEVFNHYAPRLSQENIARIKALLPGQDWRDLPRELLPDGMKRAKRKDHTRRYRRMTWDGVPRSIITRFRDPKSGEYIHPEQDRTISIREAARIQGFPDDFVFEGSHCELYDQVGNAVPPQLAGAIGREVKACLLGNATHKLRDPFARRPSIRQASFSFHGL